MIKFIKNNWLPLLFVLGLMTIITMAILNPPKESLLKHFGKRAGEICGDLVDGFKDGMRK